MTTRSDPQIAHQSSNDRGTYSEGEFSRTNREENQDVTENDLENKMQLLETSEEIIHANTDNTRDQSDLVAGMCIDSRNFVKVKLGNSEYKSFYDPGATISLVSAAVQRSIETEWSQ